MEKAIGFVDGNLCIREGKDTYTMINTDTYLPSIFHGIDEWLNNNTILTNISKIIFKVLKDVFDINSVFRIPGEPTIVPKKSEFFNLLENYIRNHPIYQEKQKKSANHRNSIINGKVNYKKKNIEFYEYRMSKSINFDNYDRNQGFSFYRGKH